MLCNTNSPLLVILLLTVLSAVARLAVGQPSGCPEPHRRLLADYKAFHDANKYSPDAQYLLHACWSTSCQGIGDRLRGALWMLRVAIAHRKILLIDWHHPARLTKFLLPNEIEWTTSGVATRQFKRNPIDDATFHAAVFDGKRKALKKFNSSKSFRSKTNQAFWVNNMWNVTPVDPDLLHETGSCYFHFLFKLNQTIADRGQEHLRQLYGPEPVDYVAWHWRHGDADGGEERPVLVSQLGAALKCATKLGGSVGVDIHQQPVLLITDFNVVRQFVARGNLAFVVTPNITARHIDPSKQLAGVDPQLANSADAFTDVFVDLYLLSRARCLMTSPSGFSITALWLGGGGGGGPLLSCHLECGKLEEPS